jgi:hypothetical protein
MGNKKRVEDRWRIKRGTRMLQDEMMWNIEERGGKPKSL